MKIRNGWTSRSTGMFRLPTQGMERMSNPTDPGMELFKPFEKETKQMDALVELALTIDDADKVPEGTSELVRKALEQHQSEKAEQASKDIVSLLRDIEKHKLGKRSEIRKLKAQLKKTVASLDDLDRRWAFAQKTNNFLPVLAFFNMVSSHDLADPSAFERLTQVPSDFTAE